MWSDRCMGWKCIPAGRSRKRKGDWGRWTVVPAPFAQAYAWDMSMAAGGYGPVRDG
jgi:hypothetical protein